MKISNKSLNGKNEAYNLEYDNQDLQSDIFEFFNEILKYPENIDEQSRSSIISYFSYAVNKNDMIISFESRNGLTEAQIQLLWDFIIEGRQFLETIVQNNPKYRNLASKTKELTNNLFDK